MKERAEHLMLVDLGRNDVGRVSRPGSVKVREFMVIECYRMWCIWFPLSKADCVRAWMPWTLYGLLPGGTQPSSQTQSHGNHRPAGA